VNPGITVAIPSIPSRRHLLLEAIASVDAQTVQPATILVRVDDPGDGFGFAHLANQRNALLRAVETEWVATLDDDDLLDPDYLATMGAQLDGVDVAYGQCRGREHTRSSTFDPDLLARENYICGVAVVRTSMALRVGGWPEDGTAEDWGMWKRIHAAGGRFSCVDRELWSHRRVTDVRTIT